MSSFKTVLLSVLLSAAAYGVYVAVTGSPPSDPPQEAAQWQTEPQIELPDMSSAGVSVAGGGIGTAPGAAASSAPPFQGGPASSAPPFGADPEAAQPDAGAPGAYPTTDSSPPPYEAAAPPIQTESSSLPDDGQADQRYPSTEQYADHSNQTVPAGYEQSPPAAADGFRAAFAEAQALLDQHRLADALALLSAWFDDPGLSTDEQADLMDMLDRLAGTVIYSPEHHLEPAYQVQPGETLEQIAVAYQVPWQLLAKINGIAGPAAVRPGDVLKVVRGPFDAVVDIDQFRLTLFVQGMYAGRFSVGVGQDVAAPEGEFLVLNKMVNPTYYGPDRMIDADDPANPLGERALDLGNRIWLHGTNDPASIARADSRGCIRLSPAEIEDVFDILSARTERCAGSKVLIRR